MPRPGVQKGAEFGEDTGIDWVGLGVDTKGFRKTPGATRVKSGDGKTLFPEISLHTFVIAPRGFVHDPLRMGVRQPSAERAPTGLIVIKAATRPGGMKIDIEVCF